MKEDKKLQSILTSYGMQETSQDFNDKLMQKITAIKLYNAASKPLLSKPVQRLFILVFLATALLLLITAFWVKPGIFVINFSIPVSQKTYTQLFSFFAVFWIVMCLNMWLEKKQLNIQYH